MHKTVLAALGAATVLFAAPTAAQEVPLVPGEYWETTEVTVQDGQFGAYADYLAAQRQRRRMIDEMADVHARYDILMTPGGGPAPHLGAHRSLGARQKWSTPSMGTMVASPP